MLPDSPATDFQLIARSNEILEGTLFGATLGAQQVVLGRFQGQLYALDGACSHQGAPLCEGDLDGPVLSCPLHNGAVDIRTGAPERLAIDTPIARYAVREVGGGSGRDRPTGLKGTPMPPRTAVIVGANLAGALCRRTASGRADGRIALVGASRPA
jgi:3-phenylpropionate/trans-cinnamate dioxygenase ferredoxin subunit